MTRIDPMSPQFAALDAAGEEAYAAALASVRDDLLAIPRKDVVAPAENVAALVRATLADAYAARPAASAEEEASLERLELLCRAVARAEHDWAWQPYAKVVANYDTVVAKAQHAFAELEDAADELVARGLIARRDVARCRAAALDARCFRILELADQVIEHDDAPYVRRVVGRAQKAAWKLASSRPGVPSPVSVIEMRNRAYTALRTALEVHRVLVDGLRDECRSGEGSGVFVIADLQQLRGDARSA
jgi:hypothetical protein